MINELYEYDVTKKPEGKYLLARLGMVFFYILCVAAFFAVCYITRLIPVFALCPLLVWILVFFTWKYVSVDYKYTVESGMLTLYTVYGGKIKKEIDSFHIKEASGFISLESSKEKLEIFNATVTHTLLSSNKAPKDPYAFLIIKNGIKIAAIIEAPEPSKKAILYYASEAIRSGEIAE